MFFYTFSKKVNNTTATYRVSKKCNYGKNLAMLSFRNKNYFNEEETLRLEHFNTTQQF